MKNHPPYNGEKSDSCPGVPGAVQTTDVVAFSVHVAVQMLVTLPPLVAVPFILLSGFASNYITKKWITIFSLLLMLASNVVLGVGLGASLR